MTTLPGLADLAPLGSPLRRRALIDAAAVAASLVLGLLTIFLDFEEEVGAVTTIDVVLVVLGAGALVFRRFQPLLVMVAVVGLRLVMIGVSGSEIALVLPSIIAFYSLARSVSRPMAYGLASLAVIVTTTVILLADNSESLPQEILGECAVALLPIALGDAARSREERLAAMINAEASSRVQAERLRIARDLHDVVAHGLAAIAVQSGTAAHNMQNADPDDPVRAALERINDTGKRSLEDLRTMVGVLRSTDEAPLRPTPSDPNSFDDLAASARLSGLDLTVTVNGAFPDDASEAVIVAAHRIAQEALTNVARHAGPTTADLTLDHTTDQLRLGIVNGKPIEAVTATESTGVGIIGMRERAESVGGTIRVGALPNGGFEVAATLPYRQETS